MEREDSREYEYDGKFQGNILIVGRTGCGKTTFIQKLGKYGLFGDEITDVFWISKIILSKEREKFSETVLKSKRCTLAIRRT